MKSILAAVSFIIMIAVLAAPVFAELKKDGIGEKLFKENCAVCHPDGGNIVNPKKTLHKANLESSGIKTAADIVKTMRNPGPGMSKFEPTVINDKDAEKIARYIIKTFK